MSNFRFEFLLGELLQALFPLTVLLLSTIFTSARFAQAMKRSSG